MRSYDLSPLFRSTIGFDRILAMMDESGTRPGWPPYNVEKIGGDRYRIKIAIAGFSPHEVDVTQQGNILTVAGQRPADQDHAEMFHQGLAFRNFKQTFSLADYVKVVAADLENGLLSIDLVRDVPEELKPRRIHIGARGNATPSARENRPKLVDQPDSERLSQAA